MTTKVKYFIYYFDDNFAYFNYTLGDLKKQISCIDTKPLVNYMILLLIRKNLERYNL